MTVVTSTQIQNNFGKYLKLAAGGEEVVIMKNGKEVARLISGMHEKTYFTDALAGILNHDYSDAEIKDLRTEHIEDPDRY